MSKVRLVNKMTQALPILLKDPKDPKRLRQHMIQRKGAKLIPEELLSPHCQSLLTRGIMEIIPIKTVITPTENALEKMSSPMPPKAVAKQKIAAGKKASKKKK